MRQVKWVLWSKKRKKKNQGWVMEMTDERLVCVFVTTGRDGERKHRGDINVLKRQRRRSPESNTV